MRVLVAESDLDLRIRLCFWLEQIESAELAGLARNRAELLPAMRVSNADVIVVNFDLVAVGFEDVLAALQALRPVPKTIVIGWQQELGVTLRNRGVDAFIYGPDLPDALCETMGNIFTINLTPCRA